MTLESARIASWVCGKGLKLAFRSFLIVEMSFWWRVLLQDNSMWNLQPKHQDKYKRAIVHWKNYLESLPFHVLLSWCLGRKFHVLLSRRLGCNYVLTNLNITSTKLCPNSQDNSIWNLRPKLQDKYMEGSLSSFLNGQWLPYTYPGVWGASSTNSHQ